MSAGWGNGNCGCCSAWRFHSISWVRRVRFSRCRFCSPLHRSNITRLASVKELKRTSFRVGKYPQNNKTRRERKICLLLVTFESYVFWPLPLLKFLERFGQGLPNWIQKKARKLQGSHQKGAANLHITVSWWERYRHPVLCNSPLFCAACVLAKAARVLEMRQVVPVSLSFSSSIYSLFLFFYAFYVITPKRCCFLFAFPFERKPQLVFHLVLWPAPTSISTPNSFTFPL